MKFFAGFGKRESSEKEEKGTEVGMDESKIENPSPTQNGPEMNTGANGPAAPATPPAWPQAPGAAPSSQAGPGGPAPQGTEEHKSMPIVEPGSIEEQVKGALRQVYDPEIGLEVIQLGLIREINLQSDPAEVRMMLTTPFCPYGGWLIQQVKDISESVVGKPIKITVLPDMWGPEMMEDPGLLMGW